MKSIDHYFVFTIDNQCPCQCQSQISTAEMVLCCRRYGLMNTRDDAMNEMREYVSYREAAAVIIKKSINCRRDENESFNRQTGKSDDKGDSR